MQQMTVHRKILHCLNSVVQFDSHSILLLVLLSKVTFKQILANNSTLINSANEHIGECIAVAQYVTTW